MVPTDGKIQEMKWLAQEAAGRAYAPYSRFRVGAAVLCEDGQVFAGCNVENASFSLTVCAERNAVFQAVAAGQQRIVTIVVYTPTASPSTPCGACRQVLHEFGPGAEVFCFGHDGSCLQASMSDLPPRPFRRGPTE